jgi:hypothetical protein
VPAAPTLRLSKNSTTMASATKPQTAIFLTFSISLNDPHAQIQMM